MDTSSSKNSQETGNPDSMYLRPDANIELLSCRWHAWQHTMSPIQHAMNLAFRQLPLLESFVANTAVHVACSANPAMLGGPFVGLPASNVPEVKALIAETRERSGHLLALAQAVRDLFTLLGTKGKGYSLDAIYETLPPALRGIVEVVYDVQNAPSMKIREELLFDDPHFKSNFSEVALTRVEDEKRNFFINTPKIPAPDDVVVPIDFDSPVLQTLGMSRIQPVNLEKLSQALGHGTDVHRLSPFFTSEPPERVEPEYRGEGVRVRYFGHACVILQTASTSVLIDPRFAFERDSDLAKFTFYDLPDRIDYVFVSHAHLDHFCPETLTQLRGRAGRFLVPRNNRGSSCDPDMKLTLGQLGFNDIEAMDNLQRIDIPGGYIVSIPFPGEHCGLEILSKHCALVVLEGQRFLFLVDSEAVDLALYARIKKHIGHVDAMFIGMECVGAPISWLYGPLLPKAMPRRDDESRREKGSNCNRAWSLVEELGCSNIYVYAMGMEPWNNHLLGLEYEPDSVQITESNAFIERCHAAGRSAERFRGCRELLFHKPAASHAEADGDIASLSSRRTVQEFALDRH